MYGVPNCSFWPPAHSPSRPPPRTSFPFVPAASLPLTPTQSSTKNWAGPHVSPPSRRRWRPYDLEEQSSQEPATLMWQTVENMQPCHDRSLLAQNTNDAAAFPAHPDAAALVCVSPPHKAARKSFSTPFCGAAAVPCTAFTMAPASARSAAVVSRLVHLSESAALGEAEVEKEEDEQACTICIELSQGSDVGGVVTALAASVAETDKPADPSRTPPTARMTTTWVTERHRVLRKRARAWTHTLRSERTQPCALHKGGFSNYSSGALNCEEARVFRHLAAYYTSGCLAETGSRWHRSACGHMVAPEDGLSSSSEDDEGDENGGGTYNEE